LITICEILDISSVLTPTLLFFFGVVSDTLIGPKRDRDGHVFLWLASYSDIVMKGAFVVRLGPETKPVEGQFEGWVEEVDSGTELRFRSTGDLLQFLGERFNTVFGSQPKSAARELDDYEKGTP
jgi:hypothetical protein